MTISRLRFILAPLLLIAIAVWARSYWRYDLLTIGGWGMVSESGAVYVSHAIEGGHYKTGVAGSNGRLEVETGSAYRPWLPFWTWEYFNFRTSVIQWWAIVVVLAAPMVWSWRRRKGRLRGFEVNYHAV